MMEQKLKIEEVAKDRTFTTMCINGLSVKEMDDVLTRREDALQEVMEKYGEGNTFTCWKCGYGIYSIRHCGADLYVLIGNSCD